MALYDYKCDEHGYFEKAQKMKDHARADCPTCGVNCKQVLRGAPTLDIEAMADIGMPGAHKVSGDRLTQRHVSAGQDYVHPKHRKYEARS